MSGGLIGVKANAVRNLASPNRRRPAPTVSSSCFLSFRIRGITDPVEIMRYEVKVV